MSLPVPFEALKVRAGGSSAFGSVGCRLFTDVTPVSHTSTTGPVVLITHVIAANTLKAVGDSLHVFGLFTHSNITQNKAVSVKYAGTTKDLYGGITPVDGSAVLSFVVTDATVGNSTVRLVYWISSILNTIEVDAYDFTGVDLRNAQTLEFTATIDVASGATPYTKQFIYLCDFIPAPP